MPPHPVFFSLSDHKAEQTQATWYANLFPSPPAPLPRERGVFDSLNYCTCFVSGPVASRSRTGGLLGDGVRKAGGLVTRFGSIRSTTS